MAQAATYLESTTAQDFRLFTPIKTLRRDQSTWCSLSSVSVKRVHANTTLRDADHDNAHNNHNGIMDDRSLSSILVVEFQGDRFLYKMVRHMVGVLVDVGLGKCAPEAIKEMLKTPHRTSIHVSGAPAHGLCLQWIEYS